MKYLELDDISSYKISLNLSHFVWSRVQSWDYFAKDTIGKQLVRAIDSISANIAEGFGRYTKKDKINFYRYSYGSIKESYDWIVKAKMRKLISQEDYAFIISELNKLPKELNGLIKFTNERLAI